jgi:hypothetical protein
MPFHIMHVIGDSRVHGLFGYAEVIETVRWGLAELGHEVSVAVNSYVPDRTNIIFGIHMIGLPTLAQLPKDTIAYNFEQMARRPVEKFLPAVQYVAQYFQVWDYSSSNLEAWQRLHAGCKPKYVPVGWSPTLRRIPKRDDEDIDVLFYGISGPARLQTFDKICRTGLKCVFACGLYGPSRDDLISRAKLVLNLNYYEHSRIFEIVRVSYLLANGNAVVSDIFPDSFIEPDLKDAIAFAPVESLPATCLQLISDDAARSALAARGQSIMEQRDIRPILQTALKQDFDP